MQKLFSTSLCRRISEATLAERNGNADFMGKYEPTTPHARCRVRVRPVSLSLKNSMMNTAIRLYNEHANLA
ncbi:MAG: hypothetical protein K8S55_09710 [Phycisphaerae bacterium]|nr:hypothetical protein [Phycisphaerae bacterium]